MAIEYLNDKDRWEEMQAGRPYIIAIQGEDMYSIFAVLLTDEAVKNQTVKDKRGDLVMLYSAYIGLPVPNRLDPDADVALVLPKEFAKNYYTRGRFRETVDTAQKL